jgi:hypothetical protein
MVIGRIAVAVAAFFIGWALADERGQDKAMH